MKIRSGFVSNSSSSSFTCDICGNTESGYDASAAELGFKRCQNDHTFCEDHLIEVEFTDDQRRQMLIDNIPSYWRGDERRRLRNTRQPMKRSLMISGTTFVVVVFQLHVVPFVL
jgi:hypothetical protein